MLKKVLISFFLATFFLTSVFVPYARAQEGGVWYDQSFQEWFGKVYDKNNPQEIFGERYTAAQVQWIIYGFFSFVLNATTGDPKTTSCLMNNDLNDCLDRLKNFFATPVSGNQGFKTNQNQGVLAFLLSNRPLSGITYSKNIARKLHLIPEAKAQVGFGFNALEPILPLWRVSRNITYALFVFAIIILAFMIMFRVKISPQTVITVQSALPKIVIALILITFSYAIAGFLVDLMYVVIGLVGLFLSQVFASLNSPYVPSAGTLFGFLTQGLLGTGISGVLGLYWILFLFISFYTLAGVNGLGGIVVGRLTGLDAALSLIGILLTIILAILLIFIGIRIIWMLLKAFVTIFLLVLAAPFQIALGVVLPDVGFGSWVRSLAANLSVFPITGLLVSLSYLFLTMAALSTFESLHGTIGDFFKGIGFGIPGLNIVMSAVEHRGWPPLLVFGVKNPLGILYLGVSVVILFILPRTADIIKAIIERKPFAYGTAISQAFGPVGWIQRSAPVTAIREQQGLRGAAALFNILHRLTGQRLEPLQREAQRFTARANRGS